ncbi:MAG: hypothetical protein JRD68_01375 [Deltaproteobacteria bacterium]|nr:hypothetical protein [Deltaproteobacteria bacterium]
MAQDDTRARNDLEYLVRLAGRRGYNRSYSILSYGLAKKALRPLCWNISSFLTNEDMESRGLMPR